MNLPQEFVGPLISAGFASAGWQFLQIYRLNAKVDVLFALTGQKTYTEYSKTMKKRFKISPLSLLLFIVSLSVSIICASGCVSRSPLAGQTNPATGAPFPAYVPDTSAISNVVAKLQSVNAATATLDPYSPLVGSGLNIVLGLATVLSGGLAWVKNKAAGTATAANVTMAQGIVKAGAAPAVLAHASNFPSFVTVAQHINAQAPVS